MASLKVKLPLIILVLLYFSADAVWNISTEADLRYYGSYNEHVPQVNALTLVIRKVLADDKGDRWDFSLNSELADNFSEFMIHELYANLKGPLGKWNITVGRMRLPWGLVPNYSTDRYLFSTNEGKTIGFESDNGVMLSGTLDRIDYGMSITQGYGMKFPDGLGHGLLTGRLGFTLGEFDDYVVGLSGAAGKVNQGDEHMSDSMSTVRKIASAIDLTVYAGRATSRSEFVAGLHDNNYLVGFFSSLDFTIISGLALNVAGSLVRTGHDYQDYLFTGLSFDTRWTTVRGGYTYSHFGRKQHEVSLQLYKLFNFSI